MNIYTKTRSLESSTCFCTAWIHISSPHAGKDKLRGSVAGRANVARRAGDRRLHQRYIKAVKQLLTLKSSIATIEKVSKVDRRILYAYPVALRAYPRIAPRQPNGVIWQLLHHIAAVKPFLIVMLCESIRNISNKIRRFRDWVKDI